MTTGNLSFYSPPVPDLGEITCEPQETSRGDKGVLALVRLGPAGNLYLYEPEKARELSAGGAKLIDIREADEHARERIPAAENTPLSRLSQLDASQAPAVIFHCRSGNRTSANAARLAQAAECPTYVLEGGIDAWRKAGLPVTVDRRQPLELMRQVQLVAGGLVLLGDVLLLMQMSKDVFG